MNTDFPRGESFYRSIVDAVPMPVLVVTEDMEIVDCNVAAEEMLGESRRGILRMRGGEVLDCIHACEVPGGCGRSDGCRHCALRRAVQDAADGRKVVRRKARMDLVDEESPRQLHLLVTVAPLDEGSHDHFLLILEDIQELMELQSILPMCAGCHKIRDDDDYWSSVESYFKERLDVDFSHGLCPDCIRKLYPDFERTDGST